jgi:hypothetical protein
MAGRPVTGFPVLRAERCWHRYRDTDRHVRRSTCAHAFGWFFIFSTTRSIFRKYMIQLITMRFVHL